MLTFMTSVFMFFNFFLFFLLHRFFFLKQKKNSKSSSSKCMPPFLSAASSIDPLTMASLLPNTNSDDCEIKPGIAEMIREEERVSKT